MRVRFNVSAGITVNVWVRVRVSAGIRVRVKAADVEQFPVIVTPTLGGELANHTG